MKQVPAINTTRTVICILAVNIAVYALINFALNDWIERILILSSFSPQLFLQLFDVSSLLTQTLIALSPISHAFIHADAMHLIINALFVLAFATRVEQMIGAGRMVGLYLLSAIAGALAVLVSYFITAEVVFVIGASGAASGLLGAYIRVTNPKPYPIVGGFIFFNILLGRTGVLMGSDMQAVAWDAHVGGFLGGFILIRYLFPRAPQSRG